MNKCNQQFTSEYLLKHQEESVHYKNKYPCIQCDHKAAIKNSPKVHMDGVHQKIKYSCKQCEYKATAMEVSKFI